MRQKTISGALPMNAAACVCVCRCTAESWGKCCHYLSWFVLANLDLFLAICVSQESPFFSEELLFCGEAHKWILEGHPINKFVAVRSTHLLESQCYKRASLLFGAPMFLYFGCLFLWIITSTFTSILVIDASFLGRTYLECCNGFNHGK